MYAIRSYYGGGDAAAAELHDVGVGAGGTGSAAHLEGDVPLAGGTNEQLEEDRVDVRATVV